MLNHWRLAMWMAAAAPGSGGAEDYVAVRERVPMAPREFRGAWAACVYNIDWPSRKGLSAGAQQAELRRILDKMAELKMNALIIQVRPHADAVYASRIEPWSPWLTGVMGRSPGYDPLAYGIREGHARGIEVHAWFNPFRALSNRRHAVSSGHITRTHPSLIKDFKQLRWMDPAAEYTRARALAVIMDVVRRYDVDGVHIDDYFYPYPEVRNGRAYPEFPDGRSAAQRRSYVNAFVSSMYREVKRAKPWVRVGISPFGIWKPGVPSGTTAEINACEHLAADSRRWLVSGWCDYLAPQLYWRIRGPQSYSRLLDWWRAQGKRPVWPGIATSRINSREDPGRPAGEIINQVALSRTTGRNWAGHVHWSVRSLVENRGGVSSALAGSHYAQPALVPPMPWVSTRQPPVPQVSAARRGGGTAVAWRPVEGAAKYAVQARYGGRWVLSGVATGRGITLSGAPEAIAVSAVDRYGTASDPAVLGRR